MNKKLFNSAFLATLLINIPAFLMGYTYLDSLTNNSKHTVRISYPLNTTNMSNSPLDPSQFTLESFVVEPKQTKTFSPSPINPINIFNTTTGQLSEPGAYILIQPVNREGETIRHAKSSILWDDVSNLWTLPVTATITPTQSSDLANIILPTGETPVSLGSLNQPDHYKLIIGEGKAGEPLTFKMASSTTSTANS